MPDRLPTRALHDPVLCMAPHLFRSLSRGHRDEPLKLHYTPGAESFRFEGPAQLGCDDLRILQGVVAISHAARSKIVFGESGSSALELRQKLRLAGDAEFEDVLLAVTSFASLANAAGYGLGRGGAMTKQVRGSLQRLAATRLEVISPDRREGWQLLATDEAGAGLSRLRIALNPRLGLCAKAQSRFVQIDMEEARQLRGDLARLLHQRLCGWIDAPVDRKVSRRIGVEKLMTYAWGKSLPTDAAIRQRRASLRNALSEFAAIDWQIRGVPGRADLLEITRLPRRTHLSQAFSPAFEIYPD